MSIKAPKIKRFSFWWFFPIATVIGFAFSTISAVLSSTSAYGQFDGAHWGLQFGVAFAAGAFIFAASFARLFGAPFLWFLFIGLSIFFSQASLNGGIKFMDVQQDIANAEIRAEIQSITQQGDAAAAAINAQAALATATQEASRNLREAEARLAEAKAAQAGAPAPQPSQELLLRREELATYQSQLRCETYGPEGASECRGRNGSIIRTKQRPGKNAAWLRDEAIPAAINAVRQLEDDYQAAVERHREFLSNQDTVIPKLEQDVVDARKAMTAIASSLTPAQTQTAAPVKEEAAPVLEMERVGQDGEATEYAFPEDEDAQGVIASLFESGDFHWGSVAVPAIQDSLGLSEKRIAAEADGATAEQIREFKEARDFRQWWLFLILAITIDFAGSWLFFREYLEPKKWRGLRVEVQELFGAVWHGEGGTVAGMIAAAHAERDKAIRERDEALKQAQQVGAASEEVEQRIEDVRQETQKEADAKAREIQDRVTAQYEKKLAEQAAQSESVIDQLKRQIAVLEHKDEQDELQTPKLISDRFADGRGQQVVDRVRKELMSDKKLHNLTIENRRISTSVRFRPLIEAVAKGEQVDTSNEPPRTVPNALIAYVETYNAIKEAQRNIVELEARRPSKALEA